MFSFIKSILGSRDPRKYWFHALIVLGVFLLIVMFYNRQDLSPYYEGFTQDPQFVLKQGTNIYDDFYAKIYDRLMLTDKRVDFEIDQIIEMTQPSVKTSTFLDIGSGTGDLVARLQNRGYHAFGIDKSEKMIQQAEAKHGDKIQVKCADAHEPMLYEKGTFTHVLCMGLTIYHFQDKRVFFKNCYNWLMPGGYLVVHLVDRNRFDTIIPAGKPPLLDAPQKYADKRITDTIIDFIDFTYKAAFQFDDSKKTVTLKETFTDGVSKKVRQNELVLYMDDMDAIMKIAAYCGFLVKGQVSMKNYNHDEHQYIVVFERPQGV